MSNAVRFDTIAEETALKRGLNRVKINLWNPQVGDVGWILLTTWMTRQLRVLQVQLIYMPWIMDLEDIQSASFEAFSAFLQNTSNYFASFLLSKDLAIWFLSGSFQRILPIDDGHDMEFCEKFQYNFIDHGPQNPNLPVVQTFLLFELKNSNCRIFLSNCRCDRTFLYFIIERIVWTFGKESLTMSNCKNTTYYYYYYFYIFNKIFEQDIFTSLENFYVTLIQLSCTKGNTND